MLLPTDEEFLEQLWPKEADLDWMRTIQARANSKEQESIDAGIASGLWKESERSDALEMFREHFSERMQQGRFIQTLRTYALDLLPVDRNKAEKIPVGFVPSREFNA